MTEKKSFLFLLFPIGVFILCLLYPSACTEGVKTGLDTVLFSALPALFPGLVLSRMMTLLIPKSFASRQRCFPLIMGILCGFPIGAHTVTELVLSGTLSKRDGERYLFFCNLTGPFFLILLCGAEVMGNARYGLFLFWMQLSLAILSYFFFFGFRKKGSDPLSLSTEKAPSFVWAMVESLSGAMDSFLYISACILFFSFLCLLLPKLIPTTPLSAAALTSFLELTSGVKQLGTLPSRLAYPILGAAVGFGGCSVHLQTLGIIRKAKLSSRYYFLGKTVFAVLLALGAEFFQKCL